MNLNERIAKNDWNWLLGWTILPVLAYWASCLTSILIFITFPVFLTVAQWYVLKSRRGNKYPAYWFIILFAYVIGAYALTKPMSTLLHGVLVFYISQGVAELLLFFMFANWRFGWYISFNALACGIWLLITSQNWGDYRLDNTSAGMYLFIPGIALFTNAITGYGLLKAMEE